jgi:hypothetical protein
MRARASQDFLQFATVWIGCFSHAETQGQKALVIARAGKTEASFFKIEINNYLMVSLIR